MMNNIWVYNGIEYDTREAMVVAVGEKSSASTHIVNGTQYHMFEDFSQEHIDSEAKLALRVDLANKEVRYTWLCQELLFEENQEYRDEALQLRTDIADLKTQLEI